MSYYELKCREDIISNAWELELSKGSQIDYFVWRKSYLKKLRKSSQSRKIEVK